jgi:hypothetical protein
LLSKQVAKGIKEYCKQKWLARRLPNQKQLRIKLHHYPRLRGDFAFFDLLYDYFDRKF